MMKSSKLLGNFIQCYIGHAVNDNVRRQGVSGGIITQTFLYLLKTKAIDGAVVSRMRKRVLPQTFIARTPKEIISAADSVYYPVPFMQGVNEMKETPGNYAVVGLPCHFGLFDPVKTVLAFSLFCNHTPTAEATRTILRNNEIKPEDVLSLKYRNYPWPGVFTVKTKDKTVELPSTTSWRRLRGFWSLKCKLCHACIPDKADICVGDPWGFDSYHNDLGSSVLIVKSQRGYKILNDMEGKGLVNLDKISHKDVVKNQENMFKRCS